MQSQLLVGPLTPITGSDAFSSIINNSFLISSPRSNNRSNRRRIHYRLVVASSSSSWAAPVNGEPDHYAVLGVARSSTSADIKRAYRLLARKYHPDVSKDTRAAEVFKSIRRAYEVLSNEVTRTKYDRALKFQTDTGRLYREYSSHSPEFEDRVRMYNRWAELRRKLQYERFWKRYKSNKEYSSFNDKTTDEEAEEESLEEERGPFSNVLRSTFISLFLLKIFGYQLSLTYSSLMALFDHKLDSGYKAGYLIAWILGGRGGILLTLCLSFASWVCGKSSSGVVVLVVVAMWVGSNLARHAPLPQGALLALLYMSLKLQSDSS